MSTNLDLIQTVRISFEDIRNHQKYLIRERIYKGTGMFEGSGLLDIHNNFNTISIVLTNASELSLVNYTEGVGISLKNLLDTLRLILHMDELSPNKSDMKKYISIAKIELDELKKITREVAKFDPSSLMSEEQRILREIPKIREIIEDNIKQIQMGFSWRLSRENIRTIEDKELFDQRLQGLNDVTEGIQHVSCLESLQLLTQIAFLSRDQVAKSIDKLDDSISLINLLIQIFTEEDKLYQINGGPLQIKAEDVRKDVERLLNTGRDQWLKQFLNFIKDTSSESKLIQKFVESLYIMSRDPKEQFLWTMSYLSRIQDNDYLENISFHYATLASSLLSLTNTLDDKGLFELSTKIVELGDISALDAIDDLSELYNPEKIDVNHLIKAIEKGLDEIKEIACLITTFDDLAINLFTIIQFTDMDVSLTGIESLNDYINKY